MDKNFWSIKWWWSLWPRAYNFVLEPNEFEITKARKTLERIDNGYRTAVRYGLWFAVFFLAIDVILLIGSMVTTFGGYRAYEPVLLNFMLWPYAILVIVLCLTWRLIAIICGALLRLVELNENANRPKG
jgi:hypothetical protein